MPSKTFYFWITPWLADNKHLFGYLDRLVDRKLSLFVFNSPHGARSFHSVLYKSTLWIYLEYCNITIIIFTLDSALRRISPDMSEPSMFEYPNWVNSTPTSPVPAGFDKALYSIAQCSGRCTIQYTYGYTLWFYGESMLCKMYNGFQQKSIILSGKTKF